MSVNKFKTFILVLMASCFLGLGFATTVGSAAVTTIYSSTVKPSDGFSTSAGTWQGGSPFNSASGQVPVYTVQVVSVAADGLANNDRISTDTKNMEITLNGSIDTSAIKQTFSNVRIAVFDKNGNVFGQSGVLQSSSVNKYTLSNQKVAITTDFTNLAGNYPVGVGVMLTGPNGDGTLAFLQYINMPPDITANNPSESSSTITGTGVAGSTVSVTIDGKVYSAVVKDDKSYSIDLGKAIGNVGKTFKLTQTTAKTGYTNTASITVQPTKLTITSDLSELEFTNDDLSSFKTDQDLVDWIVKKAGVSAKNPENDSDTFTFSSSDGDGASGTTLLSALKASATGDSKTVNITATGSDQQTSPALSIKLTKAGTLKFGDYSTSLSFGSGIEIPIETKMIAPVDKMALNVDDTRSSGTWYITATATPMQSTKNADHTLNLYYKDGTSQTKLSTLSTPIANGQKEAGVTSTDAASDWGSDKGIFLEATPKTYAENYTSTITWNLSDTP